MNKIRSSFLFATSLIMLGCADPVIDSSSDESLKKSIVTVRQSLPPEKYEQFDEALRVLMFADVHGLADLANAEVAMGKFEARINGRTGLEVIADAEKVRIAIEARVREQQAAREAKEREQLLAELENLNNELVASVEAEEVLREFVVKRSRFYFDSSIFDTSPTVELSVANQTPSAISRVYFEGVLASPGRSIPWVQDTFSHEIRGGLEPGEQATWKLSPYGEWEFAPSDRDDMILTLRVVRLDGSDGQLIAKSSLDRDDAVRMRDLASKLPSATGQHYIDDLDAYEGQLAEYFSEQQGIQAKYELTYQTEQRAEQLRQIESEIQELLSRQEKARHDSTKMAGFKVERSRFYFSKNRFLEEPVIEVSVRNATGHPISRVYFNAVLTSPGRSTPWLEDRFNYQITGGIEQGERDTWKLSPNMFSEWGKMPKDRNDMILTLTVYQLDDSDGNELYDTKFTPEDEERLAVLKAELKSTKDELQ